MEEGGLDGQRDSGTIASEGNDDTGALRSWTVRIFNKTALWGLRETALTVAASSQMRGLELVEPMRHGWERRRKD